MISYSKEYFQNNCHFFIKDNGDTISLYYSVGETLSESRKKVTKKDFDKKDEKKVKSLVSKFLKGKNKPTKKDLDNEVKKTEIDELIDSDGGLLGARTPLYNMTLAPKKTMDQTVVATRIPNDPVRRGYRVYWGESEDEKKNVVSEIDFSDAFGYEETVDKDFKETMSTLKNMGIDDPEERVKRTKQLGKLPKIKKNKGKLKQRLTEKDSIEEAQKLRMVKMVEDILTKKSKGDSDVVSKDDKAISKILVKNLHSIKKIAEKEGISINQLIKALKTDE